MALRLEVFEAGGRGAAATVVTDLGSLEQSRLAAYEQGYTAGWDDGVAAQGEDQTRLRADLARSLQGLSFTYHEARTHVLRALEPLCEAMLSRILPVAAQGSLGPLVVEHLRPLAADLADAPVTVYIHPATRHAVTAALAGDMALPIRLVDEPLLGEGQAVLRLGQTERRIDLDAALARMAEAVRDFFLLEQEASSGLPPDDRPPVAPFPTHSPATEHADG